jgi:O-antigen/teichoic acid export membrane protein
MSRRARLRGFVRGEGLGARLVRASLGSAGLRLAATVLSFLVGVLLARALGPSGYGVYALVVSTTALLTVPTEFGLPSLVTREVASAHVQADWGRMRGILRWANTVVGVASLLVLGVVASYLLFRPDATEDGSFADTLIWGVLLVPLVALGNLRGGALRGLQLVVRGQLPELLLRPGLLVLLLAGSTWLAGSSLDASDAMALNVLAAAGAFVIGAVLLSKAIPQDCRRAKSVTSPRAWTSSALPLALTEGMRYMQVHLLVLLVGIVATDGDVGLFRVAAQTAILVALPVSILNLVVAPFISRLHAQDDHERLQRVVGSAAAAMFLGALAIFVPLAILGRVLLGTFFGVEFEASYQALVILGVGQVTSASLGPNATLLNMTNHEGAVARAFALSLAITAVLSVVLIPKLSIEGAAMASTAGLLAWNFALWRYARRKAGIETSIVAAPAALRERRP